MDASAARQQAARVCAPLRRAFECRIEQAPTLFEFLERGAEAALVFGQEAPLAQGSPFDVAAGALVLLSRTARRADGRLRQLRSRRQCRLLTSLVGRGLSGLILLGLGRARLPDILHEAVPLLAQQPLNTTDCV